MTSTSQDGTHGWDMKRTKQSVIDFRRSLVARLRVRGMSQREIQVRLATHGDDGRLPTSNPEGKPWSLGTINRDCMELDKQWRKEAAKEIAQHKAEINAELAELKRFGWQHNDPKTVSDAIKQQRAMFGLDEPARTQLTGEGEHGEVVVRILGNIDPEKM